MVATSKIYSFWTCFNGTFSNIKREGFTPREKNNPVLFLNNTREMKTGVPFHGGDKMSVFSLKKKRKQIEEQSRSLTKIFMESTVNSTIRYCKQESFRLTYKLKLYMRAHLITRVYCICILKGKNGKKK